MTFAKKLKAAMQELHLNQVQVAGMTGCSKASINQYLSGKNVPSPAKQSDIALALGFNEDYFNQSQTGLPREIASGKYIDRMTVNDAARMMRMNSNTVRLGLQQGIFPWGYGIHTSDNRWVYFINARRFLEIEMVSEG